MTFSASMPEATSKYSVVTEALIGQGPVLLAPLNRRFGKPCRAIASMGLVLSACGESELPQAPETSAPSPVVKARPWYTAEQLVSRPVSS